VKAISVRQKDVFVQTNAGRIALIAYIVGGWLLPILHEHGSHQHSDSVTAEGASCAPKPSSDVTSTCGFRSHSHPRSLQNERHASDPKQKQESPQLQHKFSSGAAGLGSGPPATFHDHDLCALCLAQSIKASKVALRSYTSRPLGVCILAHLTAQHCSQSCLAVNATRGPPDAV